MLKTFKDRLSKIISVGKENGFTLIELMFAMALSLIVMGGVYSVYHSQQKSYIVREQMTMMQQNLRAGMVVMTRDIRMAGYVHPAAPSGTTAVITAADAGELEFQTQKDDAAFTVQVIKYSLNGGDLVKQFADVGNSLCAPQPVAKNIERLNFVYLDEDNNVIATPVAAGNLALIKSIQVTMVARTGRGDPGYVDTNNYRNQQGTSILNNPGDDFRRKLLSREIRCRNL